MSSSTAGAEAPRSFLAFSNPGYRMHFITYVMAMMADNIEHVISYWMAFQKFHSPALGGFAVVSHWLPFLLFSVAAGSLSERFDTRRIIQCGMVLFMGVSIAWAVLFVTDTLQLWHAMVLLVLHGCAGVLWQTSSQLLLHDIVRNPAELQSAVRLNATGRSLGLLVGPGVGALIMLTMGPRYGLFFNALFYLPLIIWLWKAPYGSRFHSAAEIPRRAAKGFADIVQTAREVAGNPYVAPMVLLAGGVSFFIGNSYHAQMPGLAQDLGQGNAGFRYSMLLMADASGALFAGFLLERLRLLQPGPRKALVLAMIWAAALASFASTRSYPLAVGLLFLAGFVELAFSSMAMTLVQLNAPAAIRGRVIGLYNMSAMGMRTFSGAMVGFSGSAIGVHRAIAIAAGCLFIFAGALLWRNRRAAAAEPVK